MKSTSFVFVLLLTLTAHSFAQTSASQTPAPASPAPASPAPVQYENQPFSELLKLEDFDTAYRTALATSPLAKSSWAFKDAGWAPSKFVPGPHNRRVLVTGTCSTRKCDLNKVQVFFDPSSKKAYAHLTLGNKKAWLGRPDPFEKRVLDPLLQ